MTLTALFRDFLIAHRAKRKFEKNLIYGNPTHSFLRLGKFDWADDALVKYIASNQVHDRVEPIMLIGQHAASFMFYWADTPERIYYWQSLCDEWHKFYEKNRHLVKGLEHIGFTDDIKRSYTYMEVNK